MVDLAQWILNPEAASLLLTLKKMARVSEDFEEKWQGSDYPK